jgi:hypothetical protein
LFAPEIVTGMHAVFRASKLGAATPASKTAKNGAQKNTKCALHFNALFGDTQYLQ